MTKNKLTIICEGCGLEIGEGYTFGCIFYCNDCIKIVERSQAIKDFEDS